MIEIDIVINSQSIVNYADFYQLCHKLHPDLTNRLWLNWLANFDGFGTIQRGS